jgi:NADH-quinone oxidoreductase subunit I
MPECGFCMSCARVCPIGIIEMKGLRAEPEDELGFFKDGKPRKMHVIEFTIDFSKCMYCGLCTDACDTGSLAWHGPQEETLDNREGLFKDFSTYTPAEKARLIEREEEKKRAKAAAAAAAPKPAAVPPAAAKPTTDTGDGAASVQ